MFISIWHWILALWRSLHIYSVGFCIAFLEDTHHIRPLMYHRTHLASSIIDWRTLRLIQSLFGDLPVTMLVAYRTITYE